jgi:tRNA pseudouridine38-40 synthase
LPRYFLNLSYHGGAYNGWQIQDNTTKTVQEVLQSAMGKLLPEKKAFVTGCGRTDTGVHAADFYAHFDTKRDDVHIDPKDFLYKLNRALPHDIAIKRILPVHEKASARFDAISRTYEYRICRYKNPFYNENAWLVYGELNLPAMENAAQIIAQTKNFKSFAKANDQPHDNDCIIYESRFICTDELLIYRISANRFIRNMVRAITGTLVEIGKEKILPQDLPRIISDKNRESAGLSAPAKGLSLVHVGYPENFFRS